MRIGVLAVQGAFAEHCSALQRLGADTFEIRNLRHIAQDFDALVLPGGESTVMKKLLCDLELYTPLRQKITAGLPVLGTCAGMILLAAHIEGGEPACFGTMDITVKRNAYGRQLGSFVCTEQFAGREIPMRFIRAPYVTETGTHTEVLAVHDGVIVAVRQGNQLAAAFHPELTDDPTVYETFFEMIRQNRS